MIDLGDLNGRNAISILESYEGKNPYIKKLKKKLLEKGDITLTTTQSNYIINNHNFEPKLINKIVSITEYIGLELKKEHNLSFTPERILIEYLLADNEKSYHVYGKLKRNQEKSEMYFIPKTQILDDFLFEEKEIEVDFEKYEKLDTFELRDGSIGRKLYDKQKEGIKFLLSRDGCILADQMGAGKALISDTLAITPIGPKRFGDLKVGERIIGSNGKPCNITGVFPQGVKDVYKITFNDGYSIVCCKEHLWTVSHIGSNFNENITLSVEQMLDKGLVIEHALVGYDKTYYKNLNGDNKWQIPIVKPIHFENDDILPIKPYLLGLLLTNNETSVNNHLEDIMNLDLDNIDSDSKFIPYVYKYSSIENRLELLEGMMGSDYHKNNNIEFNSTSERLVDDLAEIIHSLGGIVKKTCNINEDKKSYVLNIKLLSSINPYLDIESNENGVGRHIINIEPCGQAETLCISVDAPDKLYVVEHGIVTHNTVQTVVAALESGAKRILVVCPSSLKINWQREIEYFQENDVAIINGKKWEDAKFTIINYDILKNFHVVPGKDMKEEDICWDNQHMVMANFDLIIIDEAHKIKNPDSNRGAIMKDLCTNYGNKKVWLLSGTPVANRPMDYYNLLKLIKSPVAHDWKYFVLRYCDGKQITTTQKNGKKKKVWLTNGASNLEELAVKTKNIYLRRLKTEITEMPDKTVIPIYSKFNKTQWDEYNELWDQYLEERANKKKRGEPERDLVELGLLRKFVAMQAIPNTIELAEDIIEQDEKVVIFTNFTEELKVLQNHFGNKCVIHYGGMNTNDKQKSVDEFQNNDKIRVFIGNIVSAGVGITLTSASHLIFNSFDWVPGSNEQSEDRCIFEGQSVLTYNGYKLIEDIEIGDMVYTHLGNFKPVVDKHMHLEKNKLRYDITTYLSAETLSVTNDHKLYVYDKETSQFKWLEAENLNIKKHCLTFKDSEGFIEETIDGYLLFPIKNINISIPTKGNERVYDLSVEDDHSFVVGNYNVHNCYRFGQKNNVTIYYQLFEKTVSVRMWKTLQQKQYVINKIMDEGKTANEDMLNIIIDEILDNYDEE